jgi:hypothetical protein
MKMPAFIVIGAPKAGTTSLHEYLRQNPRISLPLRKETHFFVADKNSTPLVEKYLGRTLENEKPIENLDDYLAEFERKGDEITYGEVCPSYFFYPNASVNIKKYCPDAKIICILRNPVDRFYSHCRFNISRQITSKDFNAVMDSIRDQSMDSYTERALTIGLYHTHLSRYYELFPRENFKVFLFEQLDKQPGALMDELMDFVGLPEFDYVVQQKFNASAQTGLGRLFTGLKKSKMMKSIIRKIPRNLYHRLRYFAVRNIYKSSAAEDQSNTFSEKDRQLLRDYYREDILKLEKLLQKDLSFWQ